MLDHGEMDLNDGRSLTPARCLQSASSASCKGENAGLGRGEVDLMSFGVLYGEGFSTSCKGENGGLERGEVALMGFCWPYG